MICSKCHASNDDSYKFCEKCGALLEHTAEVKPEENRVPQGGNNPVNPNTIYRVPPVQNMYHPMPPKPFTWGDVCTVTGFVASLFGIFWFSVILCPIGLGLSIAGFLRNRTKGLAVAGIVVSFISIIIKIGYILYTSNLLPEWLISGVFG